MLIQYLIIPMSSFDTVPYSSDSQLDAPTERFYFEYAFKMIPHPDKAHKGGQDACYVHDNLLAVADGVSGWSEFGIDASLYSKQLIRLISEIFEEDPIYYIDNPLDLLNKAVELNTEKGSSTICLLTLNPITGVLNSVHLGDSIYGIYRGTPSKLMYEVQQQQKQFNLPYQVGIQSDSPLLSLKHQFQAEFDDFVLIGSDGLWDNVHPQKIQQAINSQQQNILALVENLTDGAYENSLDLNFASPFYQKARQFGIQYPQKGKDDDITVIGARILKMLS